MRVLFILNFILFFFYNASYSSHCDGMMRACHSMYTCVTKCARGAKAKGFLVWCTINEISKNVKMVTLDLDL